MPDPAPPRIFTVYESDCYWSMPDGSNHCVTPDDAKLINAAAAEIERLREALREIRSSIITDATDAVWMSSGIETVVDKVSAVLGEASCWCLWCRIEPVAATENLCRLCLAMAYGVPSGKADA